MNYRNVKIIVVILAICISFFFSSQLQPVSQQKTLGKSIAVISSVPSITLSEIQTYTVTRVVDGDTIVVNLGGKEEKIRLIGVDTPETVDPRKPVQCFGKEASNKAKEMLEGKIVRLEEDSTQGNRDKYGRLLRYIFLEDGTNYNKFIIEQGYAHEYTYHSNPYKYQQEFIEAERRAREDQKGLWAPITCNGQK